MMAGTPWTKREVALLRKNYRSRGGVWVAQRIGRSLSSVHSQARQQKLHKPYIGKMKICVPFIKRLHRFGYTDTEIAGVIRKKKRIHLCREMVSEARRRLGLPMNRFSQRSRRRVAKKTREQCRAAGVKNLAEVRVLAFRRFAREHGWPEDLRPRAVQMLDLLYTRGPLTRREIADALGMPWKGSRASLTSNDPEGSYLAHLAARGLVIVFKRKKPMGGSCRNVSVYSLAPAVAMERARHAS